jgi:exosortase D (VPLPA-CTERM-specific)
MNYRETNSETIWKAILITGALLFLYAQILVNLTHHWWADENYSHGLLVPFVVGYIVWQEFEDLLRTPKQPLVWLGFAIVFCSLAMLLAGTLGAELFTQRVSLVLMLAGIVIYLFGTRVLRKLAAPLALVLLSIPLPQIIFNKIAFPLQIWASQAALSGIGLFGIAAERNGNVIELVPSGETEIVKLEVVEACSGIRSLMTMIALALILAYFTKQKRENIVANWFGFLKDSDFQRTIILMFSAIPIAILTNALRVTSTGVLTYYYGRTAAEGAWHDASGWLVFIAAFALLMLVNFAAGIFFRRGAKLPSYSEPVNYESIDSTHQSQTNRRVVALLVTLMIGGVFINWFQQRGEAPLEIQSLREFPAQIGQWRQKGADIRFSPETESVLRTSDYVMRDYVLPTGKRANLYVGYYASQRTGATYHSPQNCLPGSGWEMTSPESIEITTSAGKTFTANRYTVQKGKYREILIYWYQGRGRMTASEYRDKIYTSLDSLLRRRSDGALVRVMTPAGRNEEQSLQAATALSAQVAETLTPFVPE